MKADFSRFPQTAFALNFDEIRTFYPRETPKSFIKLAEDCCEVKTNQNVSTKTNSFFTFHF